MTAIADFYETIRFLLGDHDATVQQYPDGVLLKAVRSTIRLQQIPGYAVAPDQVNLTPEVTDANHWALIAYHTVKAFVDNNPDKYSYKTRAMSESFGSWRDFLDELKTNIYRLENGTMFSTWQSYYTWLSGISGLPLDLVLTRLSVRAPFYDVSVAVSGVTGSAPT